MFISAECQGWVDFMRQKGMPLTREEYINQRYEYLGEDWREWYAIWDENRDGYFFHPDLE